MRSLIPLVISGREVLPLVEGGKGISVSNGESSGAAAESQRIDGQHWFPVATIGWLQTDIVFRIGPIDADKGGKFSTGLRLHE